MHHSLGKLERLSEKKYIDTLFQKGKAFFVAPYKALYLWAETGTGHIRIKLGTGSPKKICKRAVDRNRNKRIIREAFRLQKTDLLNMLPDNGKQLHIFILCQSKESPNLEQAKAGIHEIFEKISHQ